MQEATKNLSRNVGRHDSGEITLYSTLYLEGSVLSLMNGSFRFIAIEEICKKSMVTLRIRR